MFRVLCSFFGVIRHWDRQPDGSGYQVASDLHCIALHCIALIVLCCIALRCVALRWLPHAWNVWCMERAVFCQTTNIEASTLHVWSGLVWYLSGTTRYSAGVQSLLVESPAAD